MPRTLPDEASGGPVGGGQSVDVDDFDVIQLGLVEVSEVELALRWGASRGWPWWLGRQAEVAEDVRDGVGIVDVADAVHLRAAAATDDVDVEDALQQLVPGTPVPRRHRRKFFGGAAGSGERCRLRVLGGLGGLGGGGLRLWFLGQQLLQCRPDLGAGSEDAVESHHVLPLGRNRGDEAAQELPRLQHDFGLPGVVGLAELEADFSVGRQREPLLSEWGPEPVA